jgi:hypothetical protein
MALGLMGNLGPLWLFGETLVRRALRARFRAPPGPSVAQQGRSERRASRRGWNASFTGVIDALVISDNLTGNISAAAIGSLKIGGSLLNSNITLSQPASSAAPDQLTLGSMRIGSLMEGSEIRSAGSIGEVTVGGMKARHHLRRGQCRCGWAPD